MENKMRVSYTLHNTTRDPRKREVRRHLPGALKSTKNLHIGGGEVRLVRGRPLTVQAGFIVKHLAELAQLESAGRIEIYDRDKVVPCSSFKQAEPPVEEVLRPSEEVNGFSTGPEEALEEVKGDPEKEEELPEAQAEGAHEESSPEPVLDPIKQISRRNKRR